MWRVHSLACVLCVHVLTPVCAVWQVRAWLEEQLDELEFNLTPPPPLSHYEMDRLHSVVKINQFLLAQAKGELASAVSAGTLQAALRSDVDMAERKLEEAERTFDSAVCVHACGPRCLSGCVWVTRTFTR